MYSVYVVLTYLSSFSGPEHSKTEQKDEVLTVLKHGKHPSDRHKEKTAVSFKVVRCVAIDLILCGTNLLSSICLRVVVQNYYI